MKIGAVNSFGQVKTNNVHFEAQNKERENRGAHSNPIKNTLVAVPLATLLAMSPLNSSAAERNSVINNANETEMVEQTITKVIQPAGRDYTIIFGDGIWFVSASDSAKPYSSITYGDDMKEFTFGYCANDGNLTGMFLDGIRKVVGSEHHTEVICKMPRVDRDAAQIVYDKFVLPCPDELYKFCEDFNNNDIPGFYTGTYPKIKIFEPFVYTNRLNSENSNTRNVNKTEQVEQEKVKIVRTIKPQLGDYEVNVTNNGKLIVRVPHSDKKDDFDFMYQEGNEYWFGYPIDGKLIPAKLKGIQEVDVTFIREKKAVRRETYIRLVGEILIKDQKKCIEVPHRFSSFGLPLFCVDLNNNDIPGLDTSVYPKIKVLEPYVDEIDLVEMERIMQGANKSSENNH